MISEETFFAWLDGELDSGQARAVDQLVAADPELRRKADAHRALQQRLRSAFNPIVEHQPPEALLDAIHPDAELVELIRRRPPPRRVWAPMQWAAMAATLVLGIVAGSMFDGSRPGPIGRENGQLVASGDLEQALYTRLASAPSDDGARIGLTFRDAKGDLCRSFTDQGAAGLACHQDGDWRIRGLFQAGEGQQAEFRMAAGPDPRLAELIDGTMAGEPLDSAGERQALDALR